MPFTPFRVVSSNPPTVSDFESNHAKGRQPRGIERQDAAVHRGISVFLNREDAIAAAQAFPALGGYLAELEILDSDADIILVPSSVVRGSSHRTLLGEPQPSCSGSSRCRLFFRHSDLGDGSWYARVAIWDTSYGMPKPTIGLAAIEPSEPH